MIGADTLVPPALNQGPPRTPKVWYIATPVAGSATALTSATVRPEQPPSVCHDGFGNTLEQPLPVPLHTDSVQPRALEERVSRVPPTAVTYCEEAGKESPNPESPAAARFASELESASTSSRWQRGQTAETMSRSSEISCAQPASARGGVLPPRWLTLRKQPFALVQDGRPKKLR